MGMLGGGRAIQPNVHFQMLRMNYDCGGVKKGLFGECYLDEADREVCVSRLGSLCFAIQEAGSGDKLLLLPGI